MFFSITVKNVDLNVGTNYINLWILITPNAHHINLWILIRSFKCRFITKLTPQPYLNFQDESK
jgi:hypothetical protein